MKPYFKLIPACLIPIFVFMGIATGISYYHSKKALADISGYWLETRLSEAMAVVNKHESILHKYGLENIPAGIAKAKLDALDELSAIRIAGHGYVFVADHQGVIVSHPDKYFIGTDEKESGWFRQISTQNNTRLVIQNTAFLARHQTFEPWHWFLVAVEPEKTAFKAIGKQFQDLITAGIIAVILVTCFIAFFAWYLFQPLEALFQSLHQIEPGKTDIRLPDIPSGRFYPLARTLNRIFSRITEQLDRSQKTHAYFNTLFQNATDLITITDHSGRFTFISPSAKRVIGYDPDELIGKNISDFIHPSEHHHLAEHFRLGTLSDIAAPPTEFRLKHKDGFWTTFESVSKDLLSHPDIRGFVTTSRNVNRRKSVQDNLKKSHEALEKAVTEKTTEIDPLLPKCLIMDSVLLEQVLFNLMNTARRLTQSGRISLVSKQISRSDSKSCMDLLIRIEMTGENIDDETIRILRQTREPDPGELLTGNPAPLELIISICRCLVRFMGGILEMEEHNSQTTAMVITLNNVQLCRDDSDRGYAFGIHPYF